MTPLARMTLYFAYGSNMSRALMRARCPTAREVGTATLAGHRLIITSDGYASVVPEPGGDRARAAVAARAARPRGAQRL